MRQFVQRLEDRRLFAAVMAVLGNSVTIADGDSTPADADFTDFRYYGVSSGAITRTYQIKNTGDTALNISAPVLGGATSEFAITQQPATNIAAGGSTQMIVRFDPTSAGAKNATLTINRADQPANPYNFNIAGNALNMTTTGTGLQKTTTVAGSGKAAVNGDHLIVNYTGYLLNGFKFDSSLNPGRQPFDFTLGINDVIDGWDEGMLGIQIGEHRVLIVPPHLGYGSVQNGNIPPNSTLVFEVEMLGYATADIKVRGGAYSTTLTDGDATPATVDGTGFGTVPVGSKETHTFIVTNEGMASLSFTGTPAVQLGGTNSGDFTVTQPTFGNNVAFFTVTFKPTKLGVRTATITIPNNDPNKNPFNFTVQGTGRREIVPLVGTYKNGTFLLDANANKVVDELDPSFTFGLASDKPITGDWIGDGIERLGVYRGNSFLLDLNNDHVFGAGDATYPFGQAGDKPVAGDWDGDGDDDIGVFRDGYWYLDSNGSHDYTPNVDEILGYGAAGDTPVIGDWNGDGVDDIGVFRTNAFYLDSNASGIFEAGTDLAFNYGAAGDVPMVGDWNSDGTDDIGVRRAAQFIVDADANRSITNDPAVSYGAAGDLPVIGMWTKRIPNSVGIFRNGTIIADTNHTYTNNAGDLNATFGAAGDKPIAGDWNATGDRNVGVFRNALWILDSNGSHTIDGSDAQFSFGIAGDKPVVGDWNGDGQTDVGVFRNGVFYIDSNGNRVFNAGVDLVINTGVNPAAPVAGDWNGDGITDLGLRVGKIFYLDANGNKQWDGPAGGDRQINFGLNGDRPVIGDWNGDGIDEVGVYRSTTFYLDSDANRILDGADLTFTYGQAGDLPTTFV